MSAKIKTLYLVSLLILFSLPGQAQEVKPGIEGNTAAGSIDQTIATILARVKEPSGDTATYFILNKLNEHCGQDYDCLKILCRNVMDSLKANLNTLPVLPVARLSIKMAEQHGDFELQADAYRNLAHYYDRLGIQDSVGICAERALAAYEKAGNMELVFKMKIYLLDRRLSASNPASIRELEALFEEAKRYGIRNSECFILTRLVNMTNRAGMLDKLAIYVSELEQRTKHPPDAFDEYNYRIYAAIGRANLYLAENPKNMEQASQSYLKALKWAEERPNRLFVVEILQYLSELEWEQKDRTMALRYVDDAIEKAEKWGIQHLLSTAYRLKASYAEQEGRYADALDLTRKQHEHSVKFQNDKAGFIIRDYYNEIEKNQLATEAKNKALELEVKRVQLRNSIFAIAFVSLMAVLVLYGYYKQQQSKKKIATQYALIQQQAEQLKNLDAAKSRFFANISHELRTPLTLMLGPVKTLLKGQLPPEKQEMLLNMALQSGQQLQQLVNEILDLRKLEVGKMELHTQPTGVAAFFRRYAAQFESLAQRKQIDFTIENKIPPETAALIDREKCRQIIFNLLSNAFRFTPPGGEIRVEIEMRSEIRDEGRGTRDDESHSSLIPHSSSLHLAVSDTGPGIHPDDLPHLFGRFFQTSRPDKPAEGGTGIGLALCHEFARLLGGSIEVKSTPGRGAEFTVKFPVELVAHDAVLSETEATYEGEYAPALAGCGAFSTAKNAALPSADPHEKPTILVVEDNPELQAYIRLILQEKYHVVTAGNGKEALELFRDEGRGMKNRDEGRGMRDETRAHLIPHPSSLIPDLVLSDLMMPVMDGYQLLEKLKSDDATRHLPVIMLTARAEAKDKLKALRIGVDDYLTKPFDEEELLVRIENLLANHAVRKQVAQEEELPENAPTLSQPDKEWLAGFEAYLLRNISNDALSVSFLAQDFAMSESTLFRQLTRLTGLSTKQYLQEVRLDAARQLLENRTYRTVSQVATAVGYSNARTFTRNFKERFGKSPSEYLND